MSLRMFVEEEEAEAEVEQLVPLVAEGGSDLSQNQAGSVSFLWILGLV